MSLRRAFASTSRHVFYARPRLLPPCTCACQSIPASSPTQSFSTGIVRQAPNNSTPPKRKAPSAGPMWIKVVLSAEEGGGLSQLVKRSNVLQNIDPSQTALVQVAQQRMTEAEQASTGAYNPYFGVCKIESKKEIFDKQKEQNALRKERQRERHFDEKEIQLSWGVSMNDLTHKLKKAQQVLDKGGRISIVIVSPRGAKAPPLPDRKVFVQMCREMLGEKEPDAMLWKPEEWKGPSTTVYLKPAEGKASKELKNA